VFLSCDALTADALAEAVAELGEQARRALGDADAELRAIYELRYRGQAFELPIAAGTSPEPADLRQAFEAEHEDRYGYSDPDQELELVTIRATAIVPGVNVELADGAEQAEASQGRRPATLGGEEVELKVLRGAPPPGTSVSGPAVVELPESTLLVPAQWSGEVDQTGTIRIARAQ
jgi:N-methylhydantoinase A